MATPPVACRKARTEGNGPTACEFGQPSGHRVEEGGRPITQPDARFERVFAAHHAAVQRYLARRLALDDVNDATADVFVVAWRRIDDMPAGSELPWLYGIARNTVRNVRRGADRRRALERRVSGLAPPEGPEPDTQLLMRVEDERLLAALATLRGPDREILRLRTWEELSNRDIAAVLGLSESAVHMRLSRARKRLAHAFNRLTDGGQR